MKNDTLLKKPILKALLTLSIPIIIANFLQTAYQLTDLFWVGRFSLEGVAAIALCFPVIFLFVSFGIGMTIAGSILVAQYKGKKDQKAVNTIVGQSIVLSLTVSFIISIIGFFASGLIISWMGAEEVVARYAVEYLKISFIGNIFVFGYMSMQALFRGAGEVKIPMYIILGTVLLNLVIDPIFILGSGPIKSYGVAGAAIATIVTQTIAFIVILCVLLKGKRGVQLKLATLKPKFKLMKKIFFLGIFPSIEMSAKSMGVFIITFIVASFGTIVTAAYGVGSQVYSFLMLPSLGLTLGTATLIGQNLGAEDKKQAVRVSQKSMLLGFVSLTILGSLVFILARPIATLFIPDNLLAIQESVLFIKIIALTFGFLAVQQILTGVFHGSGDMKSAMIIAILLLWIVQIPAAYVLSKYTALGSTGIWIAYSLTHILGAIVAGSWFLKGSWKDKQLTKKVEV